jgi:hypothetical protein
MPDNVHVTTDSIRALAANLMRMADGLGPLVTNTEFITVVPGDFPHGVKLKETTNTHRDKVKANLVNTKGALEEISRNLLLIANTYERGEDLNGMDVKKLDPMLRDIQRWLPGAVPQSTTDTPPPGQPPPKK